MCDGKSTVERTKRKSLKERKETQESVKHGDT